MSDVFTIFDTNTQRLAYSVVAADLGHFAYVREDGFRYRAVREGTGATRWHQDAGDGGGSGVLAIDPIDVTYAATVTLDPSVRDVHQVGELTGNLTIDWVRVAPGQSGFIYVTQPASGTTTRTVTINAPAGYTKLAATTVADLVAQTGASAKTRYVYATFSIGGVNYMELGMAHLAAAP